VVIARFLALPEPAVLLGDLNSDANDPLIRGLLSTPGVCDAVGPKPGPNRAERIDWIIARGLRPVDAGIRDNGASDHPLVWAELELPQ
jgi:endonuclease/exonuclease/phosphatase family metal-dependent hydrolase